jgi:hypothetical protein
MGARVQKTSEGEQQTARHTHSETCGLASLACFGKTVPQLVRIPNKRSPRTELPRSHRDEISDPSPCGCTRVGRLRLQVDKYQKARLRTLMSAPLLGARLHETGGAAGVFPTRSNGLT